MRMIRPIAFGTLLLALACGGDPTASKQDLNLLMGHWTLSEFMPPDGSAVHPSVPVWMRVDDHSIRGASGPIEFRGYFTADENGALAIMELTGTDAGGPSAAEARRFLIALDDAHRFAVTTGELRVHNRSGYAFRFDRLVSLSEQK